MQSPKDRALSDPKSPRQEQLALPQSPKDRALPDPKSPRQEQLALSEEHLRQLYKARGKELLELIKQVSETENPADKWSFVIGGFLEKLFLHFFQLECQGKVDTPFAFCLGGAQVRGLGTPYCKIEGFVVVDNTADMTVIDRVVAQFQKALLNIATYDSSKLLGFNNNTVSCQLFCGTQNQLLDRLNKEDSVLSISTILGAVTLSGNTELLSDLQKKLTLSYLFRNNFMYNPLCSYLYDQAVTYYKGPSSLESTNIDNDIIAPMLLILDGFRYEYNCTTSVIPKEVITQLLNKGCISQAVKDAFSVIVNSVGKIRWSMHKKENNLKDGVKLDNKNKAVILELLNTVALLRALANERIKRRKTTVGMSDRRPRRVDFDTNNPPHLSSVKTPSNHTQVILNVTDTMRAYIDYHAGIFEIKDGRSIEGNASRLFNSVEIPKHFSDYIESFFRCMHKGIIDKDKFNSWIWAAIRRCAHDILDEEGHLKSYIQELFNKENWYKESAKKIGQEKLDKFILFSYFMNALMAGVVSDKRYVKANHDSIQSNPDLPLMRQVQLYTTEFFTINVYKKELKLAALQNANYYSALIGELACLKSLSVKITTLLRKTIGES